MSNIYLEDKKVASDKNVTNLAKIFYGCYVIVRTYSSGVHFGILKEFDSEHNHALINDSQRIYEWEGAFTLSYVADYGAAPSSKLSVSKSIFFVTGVDEIIPCSKEAVDVLKSIKIHTPA